MFMEMQTVITHKIHIGDKGIESVEHAVAIEGGEFANMVGTDVTMIVVKAGLQAALNTVEKTAPTVTYVEEEK